MARNTIQTNTPNPNTYLSVFGSGNVKAFTSDGTFTVPTGIGAIRVSVWGAGGSGGMNNQSYCQGGAGGGFAQKIITSPAASYAVTIGAGGARRTSSGTGNAGGTTSFGSAVSATGGAGGTASTSAITTANSGGVGSGGDVNYTGGHGGTIAYTGSGGHGMGGGSAAGPWGNGVNNLSLTTDTLQNFASGGAGIGGQPGNPNPTLASGTIATGGGGSGGPGYNPTASQRGTAGGFNIMGVLAYPSGTSLEASSVSADTTGQSGVNPFTTPTTLFPKFVGEIVFGGGGAGVVTTGTYIVTGGNGAPGGGGGAACNNGGSTYAVGGTGGAFGGGGGIFSGSSLSTNVAGAGGIGAGGGAASCAIGTAGRSGAGGNGLVVVEW
jgi:hypothetical protein